MSMKNILIFAIIALPTLEIRSQTTSECSELLYTPYYINPDPTTTVPPPVDPPLFDPPVPTGDETRGIFWVHGLAGNQNSWDRANQATVLGATDFPARDVITAQLTYGTNSLITAGLNLEEVIWAKKTPFENAGVTDHLRNYVIAHSQGGLVSRMTDKHYDILYDRRMFGGIVTFGTPHGGAYILNSRDNHYIEYFADEGCTAIGSAELLSALGQNVSPFVFNIVSNGVLSTVNGACDLATALLPLTLFSELNSPITDDFRVGASELGNLNGHGNPNVVKVAMHGEEYIDGEDPANPKQLMFRTFSSRDAASAPVFGADDDNELVDLANQYTARYLQEFIHNLQLAQYYAHGGFFGFNSKVKKHLKLAEVFKKAYDFMQKADDKWKVIIGAHAWVPNAPDACMCEWMNNLEGWSFYSAAPGFINSAAECADFAANYNEPGESVNCNWSPSSIEFVAKPSDGVVLEESQIAFLGAIPHLMVKTNHFQMRNSSETKSALLALYKGELQPFFLTEVK